jgi:hypothetical protein
VPKLYLIEYQVPESLKNLLGAENAEIAEYKWEKIEAQFFKLRVSFDVLFTFSASSTNSAVNNNW